MATPDLSPGIITTAAGPAAAASDAGSFTAQPLEAQIAADQYISAKAARNKRFRGMIVSKMIPPGALSDQQTTGFGGLGPFQGGW